MNILYNIAICIAGLGILNVWLLRFNRATDYRGGSATTMKEEFAVYGLPVGVMYAVGALKVTLALIILSGLFMDGVAPLAAGALAFLMAVAVVMHVKVKDSLKKTAPALSMLILSLFIALAG